MSHINEFVNRIIQGDCIPVMQQMPAASVDLVLTDPPYLVGYRDRTGRTIANDATSAWLRPAFEQIYRVLKPDRFCVSFYGWNRIDRFMSAWRGVGFRPVGHLVWVKDYASSERFVQYRHESAYLLAKGEPRKPRHALADVLDWTYTGNVRHPTEKSPMALMPAIMAFSRPGEIVLDPFAGSGSTPVAAQFLARNFVGIELNPEFCSAATSRILKASVVA